MLVIRPITPDDLSQLVELAELTSFGLTTLPRDADFLRRRIRDSERGFDRIADEEPRGEAYLFVIEETRSGKILGTSGIVSKVGGFEPFYAFRIETERFESETLGVHREIATLHLVQEHDGPSEIGSMFVHPDARGRGAGRALSLARFLFIAEHPKSFDETVIAEMRGVSDERGTSPFWDAVGRHFYEIDFPKADHLSILNKRFIADLLPRHPIYLPLLPLTAQAVVGQVHPDTKPALAILEAEGFKVTGMVDIFDAGPIVSCRRDDLRLMQESVRGVVARVTDTPLDTPLHIAGTTATAFRACVTPLHNLPDGEVALPREAAEALGVVPGDTIRFGSIKPSPEVPRP
jgi:arginine N-succinyltransferase